MIIQTHNTGSHFDYLLHGNLAMPDVACKLTADHNFTNNS